MTYRVIRQNTCLMAPGKLFWGFSVSAAARPTSSVPEKEKAAVTKTPQKPAKPLLKAPGLYQVRAPQYSPYLPLLGPPPQAKTTLKLVSLDGILEEFCSANSPHEHEDNNGRQLQQRNPELFFGIAQDTKDVNQDDGDQEEGDPERYADVGAPVIYGDSCNNEF